MNNVSPISLLASSQSFKLNKGSPSPLTKTHKMRIQHWAIPVNPARAGSSTAHGNRDIGWLLSRTAAPHMTEAQSRVTFSGQAGNKTHYLIDFQGHQGLRQPQFNVLGRMQPLKSSSPFQGVLLGLRDHGRSCVFKLNANENARAESTVWANQFFWMPGSHLTSR